jgi:hypothetical protein
MDKKENDNSDKELINDLKELVNSFKQISKEACLIYEPQVNAIINSKCTDVNHIGWTLDFMLDHCSNEDMLLLYKKLCRYLYFINPESASFYVNSYRERWEEE